MMSGLRSSIKVWNCALFPELRKLQQFKLKIFRLVGLEFLEFKLRNWEVNRRTAPVVAVVACMLCP